VISVVKRLSNIRCNGCILKNILLFSLLVVVIISKFLSDKKEWKCKL